ATSLGQLLVVKRRLDGRYATEALSGDIRVWMRAALPILLVEGFHLLLTSSDVVIVGLFLRPDKVAIYFAAAMSIALVHFVHSAVKAGAGPHFSELIAARKRDELAESVRETIHWTLWPTLAVGGIVLAAGPFLLSLFGPDFTSGFGVMAILFAGILARACVGPGESLLTVADEQRSCLVVHAGALAVFLAANVVFIPFYGIYGAAIATAAGMTAEALLLYLAVRRRLGINLSVFSRRPPRPEPPLDEVEVG
ncbi:MAG TPA: lipopolysaccharide biosynthesis protein, partial [Pararhizobium sp.]|nr:lipopolysaccharide biosynthesis protein [Pararhizobium sp.]